MNFPVPWKSGIFLFCYAMSIFSCESFFIQIFFLFQFSSKTKFPQDFFRRKRDLYFQLHWNRWVRYCLHAMYTVVQLTYQQDTDCLRPKQSIKNRSKKTNVFFSQNFPFFKWHLENVLIIHVCIFLVCVVLSSCLSISNHIAIQIRIFYDNLFAMIA